MALAVRRVFCRLPNYKAEQDDQIKKVKVTSAADNVVVGGGSNKIVLLQPRLCTLRSYGDGVLKAKITEEQKNQVSRFFETLSDYIDTSKNSQDFEIISGRLAMIVFAATISLEVATGNSVVKKMDFQGIAETVGVCLAAVTSAAIFAWFSSNRNRVGRIFTISCNTFIDSLIDQIIDGLFYETDIKDWSDEI